MKEVDVDDRLPWAISWTAREPLERTSHALAHEGRVWLIDPFADEVALRAALGLGEIAAVVQLLDRHPRDCEELARRFAVPHLRLPDPGKERSPSAAGGAQAERRSAEHRTDRSRASTARSDHLLPDSPFEAHRLVWMPRWRELCLWWEEHRALVVAEAVGASSYTAVGGRPLGVHPFLRVKPPDALRRFSPEILFPGHGPVLHSEATPALQDALSRTRRDIPRVLPAVVKGFGGGRQR
ncbi:MAG: hypothetical protein M3375_07870 [Actinomycetota bacterium]|nr:hypothetical protein [Actinomycetota bacterium]